MPPIQCGTVQIEIDNKQTCSINKHVHTILDLSVCNTVSLIALSIHISIDPTNSVILMKMIRWHPFHNYCLTIVYNISSIKRILSQGFLTRSDTNRAVQPQKMGGNFKFWV